MVLRLLLSLLCILVAGPILAVDSSGDDVARLSRLPWRRSHSQPATTTPRASLSEGGSTWSAVFTLAKKISVPLIALLGGFLSCRCVHGQTAGAIMIYFGAQTTMNLYVKEVLSKFVVSEELGMKGIPAPFLMTGLQQFVGFLLFVCFIAISSLRRQGYKPQILTTAKEYIAVCCFSCTFVLNIALNNFSISLLPLSVNLVIRSCLPLATLLSQLLLGMFLNKARAQRSMIEVLLMCSGVFCAGIVIWAQSNGNIGKLGDEFFLGVWVAMGSLFSGALNMVLAGLLGTELHLSPLDAIGYMSIPASVLLAIPSFLFYHKVSSWPPTSFPSPATDFQIFEEACTLRPGIAVLILSLGPMAFAYNFLQVKLVQTLSATHVTFAGNFNKAASIALSLIVGLEDLPEGVYGYLNVLALVGNICSFTAFSVVKERSKQAQVLDESDNVEDQIMSQLLDEATCSLASPIGTFLDVGEARCASLSYHKASFLRASAQATTQSMTFPVHHPSELAIQGPMNRAVSR